MTMRKLLIAGNWKMNLLLREASELAHTLVQELDEIEEGEVVICPPFTALSEVSKKIQGSSLRLGAQNMHWEDKGAFTGEISPQFLLDIGCQYVIIGHSERRGHFGETDLMVNRKAKKAVSKGLTPILCVGESLLEREKGETEKVVKREIEGAFHGFRREDVLRTVIAYEPIWAIGTGNTAMPADANRVHGKIRDLLARLYDSDVAEEVQVLYGGSVTPENIEGLMRESQIDGALVGGASIQANSFIEIVRKGLKKK